MRRIKINKWKSKISDKEEVDEDLLVALNILIGNRRPDEIPRGLEFFRICLRIASSFEKAEETGELILEEQEYNFFKSLIESSVPCTWAFNKNLSQAIDEFLNLKEEK